MDIETIKRIQAVYRELPKKSRHTKVKEIFGLTNAQEYAINIFGRKKQLSAEYLRG